MSRIKEIIEDSIYKTILDNIPIFTIDFLLANETDEYLLGLRKTRPAKGSYFTLGGRLFKDEPHMDGIKRILKLETNLEFDKNQLSFLSVNDHIFNDSIYKNTAAHCINATYKYKIKELCKLPDQQHSDYKLFTERELLESKVVHDYVKKLFSINS